MVLLGATETISHVSSWCNQNRIPGMHNGSGFRHEKYASMYCYSKRLCPTPSFHLPSSILEL